MSLFRKKPVIIEARQITRYPNRIIEIAAWCNASSWSVRDGDMYIPTLEGTMHAVLNDWIVKGVKGEFAVAPRGGASC